MFQVRVPVRLFHGSYGFESRFTWRSAGLCLMIVPKFIKELATWRGLCYM